MKIHNPTTRILRFYTQKSTCAKVGLQKNTYYSFICEKSKTSRQPPRKQLSKPCIAVSWITMQPSPNITCIYPPDTNKTFKTQLLCIFMCVYTHEYIYRNLYTQQYMYHVLNRHTGFYLWKEDWVLQACCSHGKTMALLYS